MTDPKTTAPTSREIDWREWNEAVVYASGATFQEMDRLAALVAESSAAQAEEPKA